MHKIRKRSLKNNKIKDMLDISIYELKIKSGGHTQMKSTSIFRREALLFYGKKILYLLEQLKEITFSEIIWCFVAGILSRGSLFGAIKPFGIAFYSSYIKSFIMKTLMTTSIFVSNVVGGDYLSALKQTAVIFLFELLNKIFSSDEKSTEIYKKTALIGSASAITGVFVFVLSGKTMEAVLIVIMEVILISVLTPIFSSIKALRTRSIPTL